MNAGSSWLGRQLAEFITRPMHVCGVGPAPKPEQLLAALRLGDVLLVEGHSRVSKAIKYLTQSTWSHAALFVGDQIAAAGGDHNHLFVEADIVQGVRSVGLDEFTGMHARICRPIGLSEADAKQVASYAIARIGYQYDLRNVFDLARYLISTPPAPTKMRRRMLALGSGDPTRAICSTLIAQAFQSIRYPILPDVSSRSADRPGCPGCVEEILHIRHHSLFAPRDFDVSPYFQVIKPHVNADFDFKRMRWSHDE
ncbi:MAG: YiiX/YebB-like N1pC/P60 family cysteine hydrolase [Steroidobacteraceae bacterium]